MTGKKLGKILLVWLCIFALVLPFGTEVLAAALTGEETTVVRLESIPYREGGPEKTGITSDEYDQSSYSYKVKNTSVLKIVQDNDTTYADEFYCINAEKSLQVARDYYDYIKVADDFTDKTDEDVADWATSVGISDNNYKALIWLLNNIYLKKIDSNADKDAYIANAFAQLIQDEAEFDPPTDVNMIKTNLTDDDIDVVQQWAIWYFTNGSNTENEFYSSTYDSFGATTVTKLIFEDGNPTEVSDALPSTRQRYAGILYNYLISEATKPENINNVIKTYPTIDKTITPSSVIDGDYYKVGPFKVNSGNTEPDDLSLTFVTPNGNLSDVTGYKIYEEGVDVTEGFTGILLDREYYVYLPIENNTVSSVTLSMSYTKDDDRNITMWVGNEEDIQPVVLITEGEGEEVEDSITGNITEGRYDLALRQFVVSVNGIATIGRTPIPTPESLENLANGTVTTAEYTHAKNPVTVKVGDRIVYEFRVFNEGDINAKVQQIVTYLPAGLAVVDQSESTVNQRFNWTVNGTTLTNTYLSNTTINKFDKENKVLSYESIQLELEIVGEVENGITLTTVAEVLSDNGDDADSHEGSIDKATITESFAGNPNNKADLSDSSYHYAGLEDDDDFEKLIIDGTQFDLSLKKFLSGLNGVDMTSAREPQVDVRPLNNGRDDANYTVVKTPINVETGDIITFTLRIYNEGNVPGYAQEVLDYIPEGLGFLSSYNDNLTNHWVMAEIPDNDKVVTLSTIKNGTKNLKLTDFYEEDNLNDIEVAIGKIKVKSDALKYSSTSQANLIPAFNGTTLAYKDVKITCIVTTEDELTLKNIATILSEVDEDGNPISTDRDSVGRDSTPGDDINPDTYTNGKEDDDDYEVVKTDKKDFDLALQKFITAVNSKAVTDRAPVISVVDGKIKYTHPKTDPIAIGNGDLITYTIRVYNEGEIDGYAAEITDDIPAGLVFVKDNETNQKYGWVMYNKAGEVTTDVNQAATVKTTYLAKENNGTLLNAYDGTALSYADVEVVFKVDESAIESTITTSARTLVNTAEISKATDSEGNEIPDIDSTPDNHKLDEDDTDQEQAYIKYFDLALDKKLVKAIVTTDGVAKEINANTELKIEINRKKINSTSIQFVYNITVTNQGEIAGYATEITDYIPEGLSFDANANKDWNQIATSIIKTEALAKTLLQPGQTATVPVVLSWNRSENNTGRFINVAEISEDWNEYGSNDVDSTPNNLIATEDDYGTASVWVGIVTGLSEQPYILLTTVVLVILSTGIFLIKKYVL